MNRMATTDTSHTQTWDPADYARHARFVSDLGEAVVELLAPQAGERILDLGCGDGVLTKRLQDLGCTVVGVDSSAAQIAAARALGLDARVMSGDALAFAGEFDAIFSNAALHWMKDARAVTTGVWRALKPGGRFVAECGGHGCVARIEAALHGALARRGLDPRAVNPWLFATVAEYRGHLEAAGFVVEYAALIPRPTPLPGDILGWLETFARCFTAALPEAQRGDYLREVKESLRPQLCDAAGNWTADYVRLRFAARKPKLAAA